MSYGSDFKRRRSEPGVYFLQSLEREAFKIGAIKQNKLKFRLALIKEQHQLVFFHQCDFDDAHPIEKAAHSLAMEAGFERLDGEWFAGEIDAESAAALISEI